MLRRIVYKTQDLAGCVLFGKDALLLKQLVHVEGRAVFGDGQSCEFGVVSAASAPPTPPSPQPPPPSLSSSLRYPFLTYGVSNLKTCMRHAKRHGGEAVVVAGIPAVEATLTLPGGGVGVGVRALHLYRRYPAVSVTLGVPHPAQAAEFFQGALGMWRVEGEGMKEAHTREGRGECVVLCASGSQPHNTTTLVLEPCSTRELEGGGVVHPEEEEVTLTVGVRDLPSALAAFNAAGMPTSSAQHSFVALYNGVYILHVVSLEQKE